MKGNLRNKLQNAQRLLSEIRDENLSIRRELGKGLVPNTVNKKLTTAIDKINKLITDFS